MDLENKIAWEMTANGLTKNQAEAMAPVLISIFLDDFEETISWYNAEVDYWKQQC